MVLSKFTRIGFVVFALIFAIILTVPVLYFEGKNTDIIFFGMGKADSILIKNKSQTILIDAGHKRDKQVLADKLRTLGIRKIDYMILSHPDKDHIGGASYILENFNVEKLIQTDYEKGSKEEAGLKNTLKTNPVELMILEDDYKMEIGDLEIQLLAPRGEDLSKSNDHSINVLIKDRDLNYFFAGDSEKKLLKELMGRDIPAIDIYKVAHHGRENSKSEEFFEKIQPKYSIITNSEEESEIEDIIEAVNSEVFYAYDKDIHFTTDGKTIRIR